MTAFYPTMGQDDIRQSEVIQKLLAASCKRILVPVSSWAGYKLRLQKKRGLPQDRVLGEIPVPKIPDGIEIAADCGGFVATRIWGDYRYTPEQYVQWLYDVRPSWAAMMDYCCEPELAQITRDRQRKTTAMAWDFWQTYRDVPWCWVPTIQGWTVADYYWHAEQMKPLIVEMRTHYGDESAWRVGIGTLCRRASVDMIHDVAHAVRNVLGDVPKHGWGLKKEALTDPTYLPLESVDSAAWDGFFYGGNETWRESGLSRLEWALTNGLSQYEECLNVALAKPKQLSWEDAA